MAEGALEPLTRAVQARRDNQQPTESDLAACRKAAWKRPDLRCWNGRRSDRPECDWPGSQNIPVWAAAGLGDWDFFVHLAKLWREEGVFGREIGSPGSFYNSGVLGCFLLAYRALLAMGRTADAEEVRLAIRAALAWDAICCLPVTRTRDEMLYGDHEGGKLVKAELPARGKGPKPPPYAVAFTGNRYSTKGRAVLTSEDAHSPMIHRALRGECALTEDEIGFFRSCINGDAFAASIVSSMMYGTIDTPDVKWSFQLTRTTKGVQSVFRGPYPNPMKPCLVVAQVTLDGLWRGMRPSPEHQVGGWADGFAVEVQDGMIRSRCVAGEAAIATLGGEILWQVEVLGRNISFQPGGATEDAVTPPMPVPDPLPDDDEPPVPPVEPPVAPPVTVPPTTPPAPEQPSLKEEFLQDLQLLAPKYIGRAGLDPTLEAALRLIASGVPIDVRSLLVTLLISGVGR